MAKTPKKKAVQAKTTIIAWNDERIMIQIVDDHDADRVLLAMRKQLGHQDEDHRWSTMDGAGLVTLYSDRLVFSESEE